MHPHYVKITVDSEIFANKKWGHLVNKWESYQHFVCG